MRLFLFLIVFIQFVNSWNIIPHKKINIQKIRVNIWDNNQFNNDKFISFTPGGIYGFYTLGIASYIIDTYDISNYSYIGASAGAWNSLVCCYKYDTKVFIDKLLKQEFLTGNTIQIQYGLYNYLIDNYSTDDFNLHKLNICITEFNSILDVRSSIISNFTNLKQALYCCMVSSHIPYITSDTFIKYYDGKIVFDGGLLHFPPYNLYSHIVISPNKYTFELLGNFFFNMVNKKSINNKMIRDLYYKGYTDGEKDSDNLEIVFNPIYKYINIEDNEFTIDTIKLNR